MSPELFISPELLVLDVLLVLELVELLVLELVELLVELVELLVLELLLQLNETGAKQEEIFIQGSENTQLCSGGQQIGPHGFVQAPPDELLVEVLLVEEEVGQQTLTEFFESIDGQFEGKNPIGQLSFCR